ncbi:hypothetical protein FJZ31_03170 [Candidatus Poribacteria bacterium]|nr:hypothetical protein [Candidatus Poribacteria bacterium]
MLPGEDFFFALDNHTLFGFDVCDEAMYLTLGANAQLPKRTQHIYQVEDLKTFRKTEVARPTVVGYERRATRLAKSNGLSFTSVE